MSSALQTGPTAPTRDQTSNACPCRQANAKEGVHGLGGEPASDGRNLGRAPRVPVSVGVGSLTCLIAKLAHISTAAALAAEVCFEPESSASPGRRQIDQPGPHSPSTRRQARSCAVLRGRVLRLGSLSRLIGSRLLLGRSPQVHLTLFGSVASLLAPFASRARSGNLGPRALKDVVCPGLARSSARLPSSSSLALLASPCLSPASSPHPSSSSPRVRWPPRSNPEQVPSSSLTPPPRRPSFLWPTLLGALSSARIREPAQS